jgi:ribonuclease P protein component
LKIKLSQHRFKSKQISGFIQNSDTIKTELFTVFYLKNSASQYAFICPKKNLSSPTRNKIKRRLKEAFLRMSLSIYPNYSLIIIASKKIGDASFKNIYDVLLLSLKKTSIISEKNITTTY